MFGKRIRLFRLLGFDVRADASWTVLAVLIVWTLARGYFPQQYPGLTAATYWWMGIAGALGLFVSIVLHEFAHALVARRYGIPMKGITLFIFGGVAEMDAEPPSARAELRMAIAGPAMSVVIAAVCYAASRLIGPPLLIWSAVLAYLALLNITLAIFNMLPAFPLDGGRVLRAYLWGRRSDLRSATRTASKLGAGLGAALIALGVLNILMGNFIGGMWWSLIGMFLRGASRMSYQQLELKQALEGEPVWRFMRDPDAAVSPLLSLQELVDDYFYRYYHNIFPVMDGPRVLGCVDVRKLKSVPRAQWSFRTVATLADPCDPTNTIRPETDAMDALTRMTRAGKSWLMVISAGRLDGILTLRDLLKHVVMKLELDGAPDSDFHQIAKSFGEPALRR